MTEIEFDVVEGLRVMDASTSFSVPALVLELTSAAALHVRNYHCALSKIHLVDSAPRGQLIKIIVRIDDELDAFDVWLHSDIEPQAAPFMRGQLERSSADAERVLFVAPALVRTSIKELSTTEQALLNTRSTVVGEISYSSSYASLSLDASSGASGAAGILYDRFELGMRAALWLLSRDAVATDQEAWTVSEIERFDVFARHSEPVIQVTLELERLGNARCAASIQLVGAVGAVLGLMVVTFSNRSSRASADSARAPDLQGRILQIIKETLGLKDVGIEDDLVHAGASSLDLLRARNAIGFAYGCTLDLEQMMRAPSVETAARLVIASKADRDQVSANVSDEFEALPRFPVASTQQLFLFDEALAQSEAIHNEAAVFKLRGQVDIAALAAALAVLVDRHEMLRVSFHRQHDTWFHHRNSETNLRPELVSATDERSARVMIAKCARTPFKLDAAPLLRVVVSEIGTETLIAFIAHHLICDRWSLDRVLLPELLALYAALNRSHVCPRPPTARPFSSFVAWERSVSAARHREASIAYWRDVLRDAPQAWSPADKTPAHGLALHGRGERIWIEMPPGFGTAIAATAREVGVPRFALLLAALRVQLLRRGSGPDLVLGVPAANRMHQVFEGTLGCFVNMLPLRLIVAERQTLSELARRTSLDLAGALAHQDAPFDAVVRAVGGARDGGLNPLYRVAVNYVEAAVDTSREPLHLEPLDDFDPGTAKLDMTCHLCVRAEALDVYFEYCSDRLDPQTARELAAHYRASLLRLVADPKALHEPVQAAALAMVAPIIATDVWETSSECASLEARVRDHVQRSATALAVTCGRDTLTYAQLYSAALGLAGALQRAGVTPGEFVPVLLARSVYYPLAVLAVLSSDARLVPLAAEEDQHELARRLALIEHRLVITQSQLRSALALRGESLLFVDHAHPHGEHREESTTPDEIACGIFTSGSTGRPKLALLTSSGLLGLASGQVRCFEIAAADRVMQYASYSTDAALAETIMALWAGASLHVPIEIADRLGGGLAQYLRSEHVSFVTLPPAALATLPETDLPELRTLCVAGDVCDQSLVLRFGSGRRFWNLYGPTECSVWSTGAQCVAGTPPTIGRAAPGARVYVLDERGVPAPIGRVGEIHIGGAGVGAGYYAEPVLTAERFVRDPFVDEANARLYKTGDLGRLRADGSLEFVGRKDRQVKLRGHRIEPEGIEAVLRNMSEVRDAAVVPILADGRYENLIAFVVAAVGDVSSDALRSELGRRLPAYMLPDRIELLVELPRLASGKVDFARLSRAYASAQSRLDLDRHPEKTMAIGALWRSMLRLPSEQALDEDKSFFELGGHSLAAVRLVDDVVKLLGVPLSLSGFIAAPTLKTILALIDDSTDERPLPVAGAMLEDGQLEPELRPTIASSGRAAGGPSPRPRAHGVLVSGATGAIGSHLVGELLAHGAACVYCLVRAADPHAAQRRLEVSLASQPQLRSLIGHRVVPVLGDLARPGLGISETARQELARCTDRILHVGAWVNFAYPYEVLKRVNVDGTREMVRMALALDSKALHFVSTMSVFDATLNAGNPAPEQAEFATIDPHELGYIASKMVAERLICEIGRRGLATRIYRPSLVTSAGDAALDDDDLFMTFLRTCFRTHKVPSASFAENVIPLSFAAGAIARLTLEQDAAGESVHLVSRNSLTGTELARRFELAGRRLSGIGLDEWFEQLDQDHPLAALRGVVARHGSAFADATRLYTSTSERSLRNVGLALPSSEEFLPAAIARACGSTE